MGAAVGLSFGLGLALVWSGLTRSSAGARTRRSSWLRVQLDHAGLQAVSVRSLFGAALVAAGVGFVAVQLVSRTVPVSLCFAVMAGCAPVAMVRSRARQREREMAGVWPDAVDNLASAVRAGLSLPEAVAGLAERGPVPLRGAFGRFAAEYQSTGRFEVCLDHLKHELASPVGDRVVEGLRVARQVGGGDLGRLLRTLSGHLRDDERTRAELEARQSWAVNGARLAVAAPWLVLLLMSWQGDVISRYGSGEGVVVLLLGGVLCLVAYRLMVRIGRLPAEKRVLG